MTVKELIGEAKFIYSLMYSPYRFDDRTLEEQIVKIDVKELKFASDNSHFYYFWGWPGPDANRYDLYTYGKGWALTKQEILQAWENKG